MTPVTILQSAAAVRPDWVNRCMRSVADWSLRQGYHYHCIGDELFEWVTPELRAKLHDRTPILADLARLRWIEAELAVAALEMLKANARRLEESHVGYREAQAALDRFFKEQNLATSQKESLDRDIQLARSAEVEAGLRPS